MINKSYKQLNDEDKQKILEYYSKMIPSKIIQKELKISQRCYSSVLKEFEINGRLKNRYTIDETFFDEINSDAKAYILGFIAADGYVGDEKHNNVVISSKDYDILEKIKRFLSFSGEIKERNKGGFENSQISFVIAFSNKHISQVLRNYGLIPQKSLTFSKIPDCIPKDLIFSFIRGYFDGDGSITYSQRTYGKNNHQYIYPRGEMSIIATKQLLEEIIKICDIKTYSIKESKTFGMYYLYVSSKKELINLYEKLYKNSSISLERKAKKWNQLIWAFNQK